MPKAGRLHLRVWALCCGRQGKADDTTVAPAAAASSAAKPKAALTAAPDAPSTPVEEARVPTLAGVAKGSGHVFRRPTAAAVRAQRKKAVRAAGSSESEAERLRREREARAARAIKAAAEREARVAAAELEARAQALAKELAEAAANGEHGSGGNVGRGRAYDYDRRDRGRDYDRRGRGRDYNRRDHGRGYDRRSRDYDRRDRGLDYDRRDRNRDRDRRDRDRSGGGHGGHDYATKASSVVAGSTREGAGASRQRAEDGAGGTCAARVLVPTGCRGEASTPLSARPESESQRGIAACVRCAFAGPARSSLAMQPSSSTHTPAPADGSKLTGKAADPGRDVPNAKPAPESTPPAVASDATRANSKRKSKAKRKKAQLRALSFEFVDE